MPFSDDIGFEVSRRGFERVDGGINSLLGDFSRQNSRCVEVCERCCGSGVGKVVRRDVNGLYGSYRSVFRVMRSSSLPVSSASVG